MRRDDDNRGFMGKEVDSVTKESDNDFMGLKGLVRVNRLLCDHLAAHLLLSWKEKRGRTSLCGKAFRTTATAHKGRGTYGGITNLFAK